MTKETITKEALIMRLKRVEGQVRGIQKMIGQDRSCENVITQLAAIRSAIDGVGSLILNNFMKICFAGKPTNEEVDVESLARSIAIWGRVRVGE